MESVVMWIIYPLCGGVIRPRGQSITVLRLDQQRRTGSSSRDAWKKSCAAHWAPCEAHGDGAS